MATTEKAKSYDGAITISVNLIERLKDFAESVEQYNITTAKLNARNQLDDDLERLKGKSADIARKKEQITEQSKYKQKLQVEYVGTSWTVSHDDDSTTSELTVPEILKLNNLSTRQINGISLNGSAGSIENGIRFRFDARNSKYSTRMSIMVQGPDDQVKLFFEKLEQIILPAFNSLSFKTVSVFSKADIILYAVMLVVFVGFLMAVDRYYAQPVAFQNIVTLGILLNLAFIFAIRPILLLFFPSWICMIGEGAERAARYPARRNFWFVVVVVGVFGSALVGALFNRATEM